MKAKLCCFGFALLLLLLCGCTLINSSPKKSSIPKENPNVQANPSAPTVSQSAEQPVVVQTETKNPQTTPTDAQIESAYKAAVEAYGWFDMGTKVKGTAEAKEKSLDGKSYSLADFEQFHTLSELETYLKEIFSDEIISGLLARDLYRDIDGELYGIAADRGSDITAGEETHQIIRETEQKIAYHVTVALLDEERKNSIDQKEYDFKYEYKMENGFLQTLN